MNIQRERICYNALLKVFRDRTFSNLALNETLAETAEDTDFITRLFYGVLEKSVTLDFILHALTDKKPKLTLEIVLKMGAYMVLYMDVADYAAVDKCVELVKLLGKGGAGGFINAVLRKVKEVTLPKRGSCSDLEYFSVCYGLPRWFVGMLLKQYGADFIAAMMETAEYRTHIRLHPNGVKQGVFEEKLSKYTSVAEAKTKYGYYVTHNTLNLLKNKENIKESDYIVQSLASIIAVSCYAKGLSERSAVLDLCAAPGGKAVCLKQWTNCRLLACDVHPHRVKLIESYCAKTGTSLEVELNDACVERPAFLEKFDCVVCDVPCSGTGDLRSKPDVLLNRTYDDVAELSKLQAKILRTAARYVKAGGKLCYSTCSILRQENEDVVTDFLQEHSDFALLPCSESETIDKNIAKANCIADCAEGAAVGCGNKTAVNTLLNNVQTALGDGEKLGCCVSADCGASIACGGSVGTARVNDACALLEDDNSFEGALAVSCDDNSAVRDVTGCPSGGNEDIHVAPLVVSLKKGDCRGLCEQDLSERGLRFSGDDKKRNENYYRTPYAMKREDNSEKSSCGENGFLRLFPHVNNTDGFFVAIMEKRGGEA